MFFVFIYFNITNTALFCFSYEDNLLIKNLNYLVFIRLLINLKQTFNKNGIWKKIFNKTVNKNGDIFYFFFNKKKNKKKINSDKNSIFVSIFISIFVMQSPYKNWNKTGP